MAASEGEESSTIEESETREEGERPGGAQLLRKKRCPSPVPSTSSPTSGIPPGSSSKAFSFWAFLTLFVSVATLLTASILPFSPKDGTSWFLALPPDLRSHYSQGRLVKAQPGPGAPTVEVFTVEHGLRGGETLLFLHGLGCSSYSFRGVLRELGSRGLHAVAVDLPGAGFSDKLVSGRWGGPLGWAWDLYSDIREKGLFWGFDHLVETGQIPYEGERSRVTAVNSRKMSPYGSEALSRILGQVIDSLSLTPVHLVLHDTALAVGADWASANPGSVRSITLVDSSSESAAFPTWILGAPVLREIVLRSHFVFAGLLSLCCSRSMDGAAAEAYLHLLNSNNGRLAVVEAGKALNFSFSLGDWAASEAMKNVPVQVLWSNTWSDIWIDEGRRVAEAIPQAKFAHHFGGRWPQEGASDEIAEKINTFVSSLPRSARPIQGQTLPEHIQKLIDGGSANSAHHHQNHHGRDHDHHADFVGAYGLGHGWGSAAYNY